MVAFTALNDTEYIYSDLVLKETIKYNDSRLKNTEPRMEVSYIPEITDDISKCLPGTRLVWGAYNVNDFMQNQYAIDSFIGNSTIYAVSSLVKGESSVNTKILQVVSSKTPGIVENEILSDPFALVDKFISEINIFQLQGERFLNKSLDYVFSNIDDLLFDKRFEEVEELFQRIDVKTTNPLVLISILTVTDSWKEYLRKRTEFYVRVENVVRQKFNKKKAEELLFDLK